MAGKVEQAQRGGGDVGETGVAAKLNILHLSYNDAEKWRVPSSDDSIIQYAYLSCQTVVNIDEDKED